MRSAITFFKQEQVKTKYAKKCVTEYECAVILLDSKAAKQDQLLVGKA